MHRIRILTRSLSLAVVILSGIALTVILQRGTMPRNGLAARTTSAWHRWASHAIGIDINTHGTPNDSATLYVANHISWFDISALGAHLPLRFLSKAEVQTWPIIGWLASRAGTLYIKRGHHASSDAITSMQNALLDDQNVCLFPEGTTTDGQIKRFHSRLIQSAIEAGSMVQPVAIFYPPHQQDKQALRDETTSTRIHPAVCFTGDTSMKQSFISMLKAKKIRAELHFLKAIDVSGKTRDELAQYCEQQVRNKIENLYPARHSQL